MNPYSCRVVLRPRDPFEVFDLSLRLARVRWWPLLGATVVVVLPAALLCSVLSFVTGGHWGLLAVPIALAPGLQAPFTLLVGRLLFADRVSLREVLGDVLKRTPALVATWCGIGLAMVTAAGLTCGAGIPLAQAGTLYMTEATLLERVDLSRGASRSLRLAGAAAGQTAAGLLVRWGLLIWCTLAGEAVGQSLVGFVLQLGEPFGTLAAGQVTPYALVGMLLSQPAWAVYRVLLYVDVRTRTEGWDLQVGLWAAGQGT